MPKTNKFNGKGRSYDKGGSRGQRGKGKESRKCDDRRDKVSREDQSSTKGRDYGLNDVSWYTRNPNLTIAAGSFPFPYRPGMRLDLGNALTGTDYVVPASTVGIPGIMSLDWIPNIGDASNSLSPAAIAAKELYSKVRSKFSSSLEAEPADFMVYLFALDSIFASLGYAKRILRVANVWTPENRYLPDGVLQAMHISTAECENIRKNKMHYWNMLNQAILASRKFTCPATMDIYNRHYWMSDNIYTDAASPAAQFYMFNMVGMYQFALVPASDSSTNVVPGLKVTPFANSTQGAISSSLTFEGLMAKINGAISALVEWDDSYTISGYLMRAYEGVPSFVVAETPYDEPFTPLYVEEVLTQIENSTTLPISAPPFVLADFDPAATFTGSNTFIQSTVGQDARRAALVSTVRAYFPTAKYGPTVSGSPINGDYKVGLCQPTISIRSDAPTVADSIIATRLKTYLQEAPTIHADKQYYVANIGAATEISLSWYISVPTASSDSGRWQMWPYYQYTTCQQQQTTNNVAIASYFVNCALAQMMVEQFDWHPFEYMLCTTAGTTNIYPQTVIRGDVHNITTISYSDLGELNKVCVLSELNAYSY